MTELDWDNLISGWLSSYSCFSSEPVKSVKSVKATKSKNSFIKDHIGRVGKGTPKGKFYLTESSMSGDFGFWCPKSAIVSESQTQVEIAGWCNIKVIEYKRY